MDLPSFLVGLLIGGTLGVLGMGLLQLGKQADGDH